LVTVQFYLRTRDESFEVYTLSLRIMRELKTVQLDP